MSSAPSIRFMKPGEEAEVYVLVAKDEERIVGMIEMRGSDHIAMLFVERQGHGIGRTLVERALQTAREATPPVEDVTVHASRFAAPIYRKLGFEEEGPERTELGITYVPMVKHLG